MPENHLEINTFDIARNTVTPDGVALNGSSPKQPKQFDKLLSKVNRIVGDDQTRRSEGIKIAIGSGDLDSAEWTELRYALIEKTGLKVRELDRIHKQATQRVATSIVDTSIPRYRSIDNRIQERIVTESGTDYRPLCNFDARIIADVERDDGLIIDRQLEIIGALSNGARLPTITIPASDFASMNWTIKEWGARPTIEPGRDTKDKLRHAIQQLSTNNITAKRVYTHTGWRMINGKRAYLHSGGAIGIDNVQVELPHDLRSYVLPADNAVDEQTAMRASIDLLNIAPAQVSIPIWATIFASVLTEIIEPAFTLWIEGESGARKSSYAALLLNHFGPTFDEYHMPANWESTANSLERLAFHMKDAPLVIDDFKPAHDKITDKKMHDALQRITRAQGNRGGRSRMNGESEFKQTYPPRGAVIATAERNAIGKSTLSRMLTVTIEKGMIDMQKLTAAQAQRHVYSYAMAGFIRYCIQHWERLERHIRQAVYRDRTTMAADDQHGRHSTTAAVLVAAFGTAIEYAKAIKAITVEEMNYRLDECTKVLIALTARQNTATKAEDPALRFMTMLISQLAQRKSKILAKADSPASLGYHIGGKNGSLIGWRFGGRIHLYPGAYGEIYQVCEKEGVMFTSDRNTLARELVAKGFMDRGQDEIQLSRRDLEGAKQRVYVLREDKFFELAAEMGILHADLEYSASSDDGTGDGTGWNG